MLGWAIDLSLGLHEKQKILEGSAINLHSVLQSICIALVVLVNKNNFKIKAALVHSGTKAKSNLFCSFYQLGNKQKTPHRSCVMLVSSVSLTCFVILVFSYSQNSDFQWFTFLYTVVVASHVQ